MACAVAPWAHARFGEMESFASSQGVGVVAEAMFEPNHPPIVLRRGRRGWVPAVFGPDAPTIGLLAACPILPGLVLCRVSCTDLLTGSDP